MDGIGFEYPWLLPLALILPLTVLLRRRQAADFSAVEIIGDAISPSKFRRRIPDLLAALFLLLAPLAAANFRYSAELRETVREARWIMIVQDLSGSMNRPAGPSGETLGDLALEGARTFIQRRDPADLIGLVAFSSHARLVAPPTLDRAVLADRLALLDRRSDSAVFRELTAGGATNVAHAAWLALSGFLMMSPPDRRPTSEALESLRAAFSGRTGDPIAAPSELDADVFSQGMALVIFTDGRIEAGSRDGGPNFANVARWLREMGVGLYLIVVGETVDPAVRAAVAGAISGAREETSETTPPGRIFFMPGRFDAERIRTVYGEIDRLEKNRLRVSIRRVPRETRRPLTVAAGVVFLGYGICWMVPGCGRW
ncbi:MAG: vWA domain-containing protein [Desulfococcaceae bacterium]